MNSDKKIEWLERVFDNNPEVRRKALKESIPHPLFESGKELGKAIDKLLAKRQ